jgi:hypothetical protein
MFDQKYPSDATFSNHLTKNKVFDLCIWQFRLNSSVSGPYLRKIECLVTLILFPT